MNIYKMHVTVDAFECLNTHTQWIFNVFLLFNDNMLRLKLVDN